MRYMLLMSAGESGESGESGEDSADATPVQQSPDGATDGPCWGPWAELMKSRGVVLRDGARLYPTSAATTIRLNGGEVLVCDGPFAETKDQIGGYEVIECADLDAAIEAASAHPVVALGGTIEVRPIMEEDD